MTNAGDASGCIQAIANSNQLAEITSAAVSTALRSTFTHADTATHKAHNRPKV